MYVPPLYDNWSHTYTRKPFTTHTFKWMCPRCGMRSLCTFLTAEEAEQYGRGHRCD